MLRTLKPVEIAEGALLADIAVVYQLLVNYVPFVGDFFRFPIFIVLAILVLRRGLYVGIMSGCVALFLAGILMGPSLLPAFAVELLGGLYLGVVMRLRVRSTVVILVGATCGSLLLYLVLGTISWLAGVPASNYIQSLHNLFVALGHFFDLLTLRMGGFLYVDWHGLWQHHILLWLKSPVDLAFTYWQLSIYLLLWAFSLAATFLVYMACNLFVRMLGYEVRPFPSERTLRMIQRRRRLVVRLVRQSMSVIGRFYAKV
jgi:hypothetical protein